MASSRPQPASIAVNLHDPRLYINRELSWLEFNQRVLDQALGDTHPLLERVKFLAIVASNMDEFFMVRVATLLRKLRAGIDDQSIDGMTVSEQVQRIRARAARMRRDQASCWNDQLRPALASRGIRILEPEDYTEKVRHFLTLYFRAEIYPLLTPLAFDPGHPFPLISNRSKNFAVTVRIQRRTRFARVKVPQMLPRFVQLPHGAGGKGSLYTFAFLEDVIRMNLGELFTGVEMQGAHLFRIIRDTDIELRDVADDLMESMDRTLREQRRGLPSLLQTEASMPARVLRTLVENFEVEDAVVERTPHRLDFSDWMALWKLPLSKLKDAPLQPRTVWSAPVNVFEEIQERDVLVHHPFESFSAVETFLEQASTDPHVTGIKMTLYRIGANSPLIENLINAADAGKQVAVLVELKARFDERANIEWATRLESAGVHVVYGVEGLKTHCKLCLVVRRETDGVRRYAHIGTGNYNRATAQVYTDLSLFTCNEDVIDDVGEVFNYLTGYSRHEAYDQLLVAPVTLRRQLRQLIEREIEHARAGRPAHIIIKCNAVTDPEFARALYRASQAGVSVELVVRGTCVLRPGLPGVSERLSVRSIVGRFLEHSRIYWFANNGHPDVYLGSADLMERNLDRRVETLCRIVDTEIARHLREVVLKVYLSDTARAYVLVDDKYQRPPGQQNQPAVNAQELLLERCAATPSAPPDDDGAGEGPVLVWTK
jgi:polyphosphate kinase